MASMEVEEDPSSQFVDFTNATALEQFVSDVEQTLITWQLSNKGHVSPEALSAALPAAKQQQQQAAAAAAGTAASALDEPLTWTRVLELEQPGSSSNVTKSCYALTLFVRNTLHEQRYTGDAAATSSPSSGAGVAADGTSNSHSNNNASIKTPAKKWQQGLEHFTPTMLSIADTSRDFHWHSWRRRQQPRYNSSSSNSADMNGFEDAAVLDTSISSLTLESEPVGTKRATFERVQKWFGVDAFVFLSRTAQSASKKPASTMHRSRPVPVATHDAAAARQPMAVTVTTVDDSSDKDTNDDDDDFLSDLAVSPNEAALLLSALTIALTNCSCTLPAFVPTFEPSRGAWLGSAVPGATGNVSIAFETDSIPEVSSNQSCISGLLDFFRLKLQLPLHIEDRYRRGVTGSDGDADAANVPIGMLVSASFGYRWTRAEDPREIEAAEPSAAAESPCSLGSDSNTAETVDPQRERVVRDLFGPRAHQCVGAATSPLLGMDLTVIWPNLREGTYVDNVVHSSLDAKKAPEWILEARFERLRAENVRKPTLALSKVVANLVQAYSNSRELSKDILVSELAPNLPPSSSSSLTPSSSSGSLAAPPLSSGGSASVSSSSRLQESIPAARAAVVIGNAIGTLTSSLVSAATWKGTDMEEIRRTVVELFDSELQDGAVEDSSIRVASAHSNIAHSAPIGELVSIVACRMGQLHGLSAMSLLWVEFVKMLRERWFQLQLLPAMSTAVEGGDSQQCASTRSLDALFLLDSASLELPAPDFHQCLLHQKLQLLNCCILRQAENTRSQPPASSSPFTATTADLPPSVSDLTSLTLDYQDDDSTEDSPASDDEFFDSIEQHDIAPSLSAAASSIAQGVRRPMPGVYCLTTNAVMMEPITQVAVPMTEDVAKQQQDLLARLGASVESAMLRQQLQSAALVSDMQAFKAANPRCCLADFIRWYSPKDWIPFDPVRSSADAVQSLPPDGRGVWWFENHGMLSDRMRFGTTQQHLWQQMWATASAVPVVQQKCLFDPLHESERIYHYLETISPHELFHQMLAGALASAVYTLETALPFASSELPVLHAALHSLRERCRRAIALLDDALAESQVAFPAGRRNQREEHERAKGQLQVAFEMALDASWKLVSELEAVEALVAIARALVAYFPPVRSIDGALASESIELVNLLLLPHASSSAQAANSYDGSFPHSGRRSISELLQVPALRERVTTLVLLNPVLAGPVQREYVLRCISPRPYLRGGDLCASEPENGGASGASSNVDDERALEQSPLVVNRMYAAFMKNTVRFALVLAESEF